MNKYLAVYYLSYSHKMVLTFVPLFFSLEVGILLLNFSYMRGSNCHDHTLSLF